MTGRRPDLPGVQLSEVARCYGVSRSWVHALLARCRAETPISIVGQRVRGNRPRVRSSWPDS
ncbi:MAG TPA: hypothetical protein VF940_22430 [Streptosporangiaceae bacterium]